MLPLLLPFSILTSKITFSNVTRFKFYSFTSGKKDLARNIFFIFLRSQKLECTDLIKQKMNKNMLTGRRLTTGQPTTAWSSPALACACGNGAFNWSRRSGDRRSSFVLLPRTFSLPRRSEPGRTGGGGGRVLT
jgi:hypothetical protein